MQITKEEFKDSTFNRIICAKGKKILRAKANPYSNQILYDVLNENEKLENISSLEKAIDWFNHLE